MLFKVKKTKKSAIQSPSSQSLLYELRSSVLISIPDGSGGGSYNCVLAVLLHFQKGGAARRRAFNTQTCLFISQIKGLQVSLFTVFPLKLIIVLTPDYLLIRVCDESHKPKMDKPKVI